MSKKYWLHRISYERDVSKRLIDNSLLSFGWDDRISDGAEVISVARNDGYDAYKLFMKERCPADKKPYMVYNFIAGMSVGDMVVVPLCDSKFAVYEITGKTRAATAEERRREDGTLADLFVMPVVRCTEDVKRADYADNALMRCMKYWGSNCEITRLQVSVAAAVGLAAANKPMSFRKGISDKLTDALREEIAVTLNEDKKFEQLIAWYFEKKGAEVECLSGNAPDKGKGDADVVARFRLLGDYDFATVLYIQAKHHDKNTLTGEEAVRQVSDYLAEHSENSTCAYKALVISAADDFTDAAKDKALENDVALITGREFAGMLINAGISGIDDAFD